jgi:hypothetical protein
MGPGLRRGDTVGEEIPVIEPPDRTPLPACAGMTAVGAEAPCFAVNEAPHLL